MDTHPGHSVMPFSLTTDGLPFPPRPCFNWLPQYRYGLFAYKALQDMCAARLSFRGDAVEFSLSARGGDIPVNRVRPILMDAVLRSGDWQGYVLNQAEHALERFTNGELYYPVTADIAVVVARETGAEQLLNNILSYMVPAPQAIEAALALGGGYAGASAAMIGDGHTARVAAVQAMTAELAAMYGIADTGRIRLHSAGVGGLVEAATRYMHVLKPGYRTCLLVPEYWDFLRCVLTYSPGNISVVHGREQTQFPEDAWLQALSRPDIDFAYISYTNNPLGTTVPRSAMLKAIEAIPDDALFFIDCTSLDTEESSSVGVITDILRLFAHKNLLITKSFAKEYNKGHLRVGYGLFTRPDVAEAFWPFMAAHSPVPVIAEARAAIRYGSAHVLEAYRLIGGQLRDFASAHPRIRVTGTTSNYTSLFFESEAHCTAAHEALTSAYGDKVFPGELPMQGGGDLGLGRDEVSLTSMKKIPFLPTNALRLLVTETSVTQVHEVLRG